MQPPSFLTDYANVAEPRLGAFLAAKAREFEQVPVDLRDAFSFLRDYLLRGGKRLRGALVLLGNEAAGGDGDEAVDASIGIELLHAYLLIHDDFMDQDDVRRGGPTLHRALGGDHLAASLALLCGSLCETWAYQLLRDTRLVSVVMEQVILGQMADLRAPQSGRDLGRDDILNIQQRKTGSYTFELPLAVGAMIAGANDALLRKLSAYAGPLGVAFQIADDLLGSFGSPEVTGKPSGNDLREGKRTLLVARALEMAAPADAARLRSQLGKPDADVEELRDILRRSGAYDAARTEADQLCRLALMAVDSLPGAVRERLSAIATYTVQRAL